MDRTVSTIPEGVDADVGGVSQRDSRARSGSDLPLRGGGGGCGRCVVGGCLCVPEWCWWVYGLCWGCCRRCGVHGRDVDTEVVSPAIVRWCPWPTLLGVSP